MQKLARSLSFSLTHEGESIFTYIVHLTQTVEHPKNIRP